MPLTTASAGSEREPEGAVLGAVDQGLGVVSTNGERHHDRRPRRGGGRGVVTFRHRRGAAAIDLGDQDLVQHEVGLSRVLAVLGYGEEDAHRGAGGEVSAENALLIQGHRELLQTGGNLDGVRVHQGSRVNEPAGQHLLARLEVGRGDLTADRGQAGQSRPWPPPRRASSSYSPACPAPQRLSPPAPAR